MNYQRQRNTSNRPRFIGSSIAKVSKEKGIKVHGFDVDEASIKHA
jgi:hypothetical protein